MIVELKTRLNAKLEAADLEPMTDLVKDFSNGVKLIQVSQDRRITNACSESLV